MNQNKNYIILIGSLVIFFVLGYLLLTYQGEKKSQVTIASVKKVKIDSLSSVEISNEEVPITENPNMTLTENPQTNTTVKNASNIKNNDLLAVEQISNDQDKVLAIINRVIPNANHYRVQNLEQFNNLLVFAYNHYNSVIPSDKNSDEFIKICNSRDELFHQLKKSKINYDSKKIDNLCL
jgi:hypothetical protein